MAAELNKDDIARKKLLKPKEVPCLELGNLVTDAPEDKVLSKPVEKKNAVLSPSSRSAVSWGSPLTPPYALTTQDIEIGGTVYRPCTHVRHKRPGAPQRNPITHTKPNNYTKSSEKPKSEADIPAKHHNIKQTKTVKVIEGDIDKTVIKSHSPHKTETNQTKKSKYWYLDKEFQDESPRPEVIDTQPTVDEMAQMQTKYTTQPYTNMHVMRKSAAEDDQTKKQKDEIMEQVLVDQLSRHVLSDVEQDRDPARQNPADPASRFNTAPLRFKSRRLHETKVCTSGAATESKLRDKITFGARLITRDGRDALRELFGFYFNTDQTLTVYEFRLFGKNSVKALPIIDRGRYQHVIGRRKGKNYNASDFKLGRNLTFLTKKQQHLPDSIKKLPVVTMRICEASSDEPSRDWDISSSDRGLGSDSALERQDRKITKNVQNYIRKKLHDRSVSVVVGLGRLFRMLDASGDGLLSKSELGEALNEFDITLPQQDFDAVWRVVDENNDGAIDYGEFMRAFIGEMNETRKQLVRKVFKKLDPHKTGKARLLDLQKLYNAKQHPLVVSGEMSQSAMEEQFLSSFSEMCSGTEVSFVEFEEYYEGLSIVMREDEDFINMMRNCWGI